MRKSQLRNRHRLYPVYAKAPDFPTVMTVADYVPVPFPLNEPVGIKKTLLNRSFVTFHINHEKGEAFSRTFAQQLKMILELLG
ncbi:hypothetical protein D3C85_1415930 [compost metagenome]